MLGGLYQSVLATLGGLGAGKGLAGLMGGMDAMYDLGGLSDEDKKKNIEKETEELGSFLDALDAYEYEYKNKKHGEGKKFGIMAQDLQKSRVGKTIVKDTPEGLMIDAVQAVGPTLAALGHIHKRLKKLEGKK